MSSQLNPNIIETRFVETFSNREFYSLWTAAKAILLHQNFELSAEIIFDEARKMTGATSGYIALLDKTGEENEVLFLESGGLPCSVDPKPSNANQGITGRII